MLCLAVMMLSATLTGCTIGNTEIVFDMNTVGQNHVFSVNGEKCSKEEARLYLCNYQNIYGTAYGLNLWEYDLGEKEKNGSLESYVKDVTLSQLTNIMCMEQLAKQEKITLTEAEKKKVRAAAEEYYKSLSKKERSYMDINKNKIEDIYEKYALAQKLYNTLTQGVDEEVSDDEARVIRIQKIFVSKNETALLVQQKLLNGEKFENLVSTYNEGEKTTINLSRKEAPKAVEDVAFCLDNNEVSDMITTEEGYYFIKCLNKFDEELTEENKKNIIVKRRKEQFDDKYLTLIETSEFELNERVWESIKIDASGEIKTKSFFEIYEKHFSE
ncbi:MAG: peptidyl-prolyl cis-trans isomerase [Agathobacter sp.]|nr:peptidyl-prolyl cis-trans isomerase [Agathobacter sp.]